MKVALLLLLACQASFTFTFASPEDIVYGYECHDGRCVKIELSSENFDKAISLPVCRMFCSDTIGTVWPKPTGLVRIEPFTMHIDRNLIDFELPQRSKHSPLWQNAKKRFVETIAMKIPNVKTLRKGGHPMRVTFQIDGNAMHRDSIEKLTLSTDESYVLNITHSSSGPIVANIIATTYFGARHGLETLLQTIVYDDIRRELQVLSKAEIHDGPVFKWRGLLLDTARNFYSVKAIKRTLDGMAMTKLNTFHWHITDSHSFPFEVKSQPEMSKLGAYSPRKVYTHEDIADIIAYGLERGIRVMPEFDAPAHVGEGWQHKNMTVCFGAQPWINYCVEPPCGQLDPTADGLYDVLENIYREMFQLFDPDVFHMGGDEVAINCWNSTEHIRKWMLAQPGWGLSDADFIRLWSQFQTEALKRVDRVAGDKKPLITLWTSHLTDVPYLDENLDKDRYIIQIWTTGMDPKVQEILKRGYRVIVSNSDALYFDCGAPGWVNDGNNWCSPFIGWQKVYDNRMETIAGDYVSQVLGAEAAIWSEQIDEFTLDYRYWPRASAMAERLWSNPDGDWRQAESRMLMHRERLVEHGIGAEAMQPEWCVQNENECPLHAYDGKF